MKDKDNDVLDESLSLLKYTDMISDNRKAMIIKGERNAQLGLIPILNPEIPLVYTNYESEFIEYNKNAIILTDNAGYFIFNGLDSKKYILIKGNLMAFKLILTDNVMTKICDILNDGISVIVSDELITEIASKKLSISYIKDTDSFMIIGNVYSKKGEVPFLEDTLDRKSLEIFYEVCKCAFK